MGSTQPARQFWPRLAPARDVDDLDGRNDGQTAVDPSIRPSERDRPSRARALTPSERRLVRWLESYCCTEVPKHRRPYAVSNDLGLPAFVGGRLFVLCYGAREIVDVLQLELTQVLDGRRHWLETIVSPAQFLHAYMKRLAWTGGDEGP